MRARGKENIQNRQIDHKNQGFKRKGVKGKSEEWGFKAFPYEQVENPERGCLWKSFKLEVIGKSLDKRGEKSQKIGGSVPTWLLMRVKRWGSGARAGSWKGKTRVGQGYQQKKTSGRILSGRQFNSLVGKTEDQKNQHRTKTLTNERGWKYLEPEPLRLGQNMILLVILKEKIKKKENGTDLVTIP